MEPLRDVAVVGGGPAGSAAALWLARLGHDVVLLDEARFPRDKICGESVSPGAWQQLEDMGVAPAVRRAGARPIAGMCLTAPDGTSFAGSYDGGRTVGYSIERRVLDALLLDHARAAGVEVHEQAHVVGLVGGSTAKERAASRRRMAGPDAERCVEGLVVRDAGTARTGAVRAIRARVVIGADGRRSVVARQLGLLREARRPRRFAVHGHWDGMPGLTAFGEMHVGAGGYCGLAPLPGGRANVTFVLDQAAMPAAGGDLEGFYRSRLRAWPRIFERLEAAQLAAPPRAIGPLALESARVWAPGALLIGDAAGFFDPFTGEGIAAALRSAERAAAVADAALRGTGSLALYGQLHHELVAEKFRFNRMLQWIVGRERLACAAARVLLHLPSVADRLVGLAGDCFPARSGPGAGPPSCRMASPELRSRARP
jgi:menaquinone-9 beta-reductase